jgi:hypothetical protein
MQQRNAAAFALGCSFCCKERDAAARGGGGGWGLCRRVAKLMVVVPKPFTGGGGGGSGGGGGGGDAGHAFTAVALQAHTRPSSPASSRVNVGATAFAERLKANAEAVATSALLSCKRLSQTKTDYDPGVAFISGRAYCFALT